MSKSVPEVVDPESVGMSSKYLENIDNLAHKSVFSLGICAIVEYSG